MKALLVALLFIVGCAKTDETFTVTAPNVKVVVKVKADSKVTVDQARALVEHAVNAK